MKVTRLEIFGFKSFLERFVLNFDKNMIGIVGPNGCGKSNVVDALRWVLGETHAKQLRGGSFEDLIFNGSESKRPLGMAEVSLTIEPDSDWDKKIKAQSDLSDAISELDKLESVMGAGEEGGGASSDESEKNESEAKDKEEPLSIISKRIMEIPGIFDVAEVQFTRRLYRSGESEYFINKVPCRLRDLQDVYRLIGLGARGLSIVQQGQIGQFISKKPLERRELLEEAAGISGFRTKMEAASRRLDKTNDNLARATDIISEVEKQVRSLKKQAQRAMTRQSIKEELYDSEKEFFSLKSSKLVHTLIEKEKTKSSLEEDLEIKTAHIESFEARIIELDSLLHEAETSILELRRNKDSHARALLEQEARIQNIRVSLASLQSESQHLDNRINDGNSRLDSIQQETEVLQSEIQTLEDRKRENEISRSSQTEVINALKQEHSEKINAFIENSKNELSSSKGMEIKADSTSFKIIEISSKINEKEAVAKGAEELHRKANSQKNVLKQAEQKKLSLEKKLTTLESEVSAIDKQITTFTDHARNAVGAGSSERKSDEKVLLSLIEVPQKYERAVHAILGERSEYLLSSDADTLLAEYISNVTLKRKKTGVISRSVSQLSAPEFSNNIPMGNIPVSTLPAGIIPVLDIINFDKSYHVSLSQILGDAFFAESREAADTLKRLLHSQGSTHYTIALEGGEIVTPWGWYSTDGEGVHFSFVRRRAELDSEIKELVQLIESAHQELTTEEERFTEIQSEIEALNNNRNELHLLQKELSELLKFQAEEDRKKAEQIRVQERTLREEFLAAESKEVSILREFEQEGLRTDSSLKNASMQVERLGREIYQIRETLGSLVHRREEIVLEINSVKETISVEIASSSSEESIEHKRKISELETSIELLENERLTLQKEVGQIRYEQSESRRSRESVERNLRSVTSEVDRTRIELEMFQSEFEKQYPEDAAFTIPDESRAKDLLSQYSESYAEQSYDERLDTLHSTSQSLRKRLEREGEVDPQSIELYEQEQARLTTMTTQVDDLRKAKETLEKTIRQLKELSRIRFLETFKAVNEKFKELVPRLFAGGSGQLELLNPDDPLQSGVNIIVRPPGKKITTMELMSGGEKALVATAVLVAVFLHHPGPICVLDEVDAPLDDANLGRFLSLIREISDRTQFLVITHNKLTMQAVDRLIGITMQESGITTAISVDLEEAEEEIEKWIASAA